MCIMIWENLSKKFPEKTREIKELWENIYNNSLISRNRPKITFISYLAGLFCTIYQSEKVITHYTVGWSDLALNCKFKTIRKLEGGKNTFFLNQRDLRKEYFLENLHTSSFYITKRTKAKE